MRELDEVFREISREAWDLDVPSLTPAWRDAVRFWLVVDDNKPLLGRLLRETAKRKHALHEVKLTSRKNREWIVEASRHVHVATWIAPRRSTFAAPSGARYTVVLEDDPLEVLRMGIPFGTCLSLENGCNAASTVLNALDANKRVIYVRNAQGKVVARKLIALNEDFALIGYNLYVSMAGGDEAAVRGAVEGMCRALATELGTRLAVTGKPARIHKGFWYDDQVVAFAQDELVSSYCRAHGLAPPDKTWPSLVDDARGWAAMEAGDIEGAIDALSVGDRSISNVMLSRWVVDHLGMREAMRRTRRQSPLLPAICRVLADEGEGGILRALPLVGGDPAYAGHSAAEILLDRAPRSAKIADAFVRAAETSVARARRLRWSMPHRTFTAIAPLVDGVLRALQLCDRLEPLWQKLNAESTLWTHVEQGEDAMIDAVLSAYEREPDDAAVVQCLMSARRSTLAHRAALRVAARHFLDDGARALTRFVSRALRKGRAFAPDAVAAIVRQSGLGAVKKMPAPSAPIFEALGPLLFSLPEDEIASLVTQAPQIPDDTWAPGPWELAWRRRHPDPQRRERLVAQAVRAPFSVKRPHELLALLADEQARAAIRAAQLGQPPVGTHQLADALLYKTPEELDAVFTTLVAQVKATEVGTFDVSAAEIRDRLFAERARDALPATANLVVHCGTVDDLLRCAPGYTVDEALALALSDVPRWKLHPALVAELWQRHALRQALARAFVKGSQAFGSSIEAVERAAERAGLPLDGFFEESVRAVIATSPTRALDCESLDQLKAVIAVAMRESAPRKLAELYQEMNDLPAVGAFLRALEREPPDRAAAIRGEMKFDDADDPHRHAALAAWIRKK
jgi:hypothetical protein